MPIPDDTRAIKYAESLTNLVDAFNETALSKFQLSLKAKLNPNDLGGKKARSFAVGIPGAEPSQLPDYRVDRAYVLGLVEQAELKTAIICAAIMAWGGMRINHRDMLSHDLEWLDVADRIRRGFLDRRAAYIKLKDLSADDRLKGMGPAFFTKLIYFLSPRSEAYGPQAYIMDQWAGCSVNLLTGRNAVLMDTTTTWESDGLAKAANFRVSNANSGHHYEDFCTNMDALAHKCEKSADEIDRAVMGNGGKQKAGWREYVIRHRSLQ
ncbi:MAG: hypothetical protein HRU33_10635 [Rhodobacteraceae bacterium]|nr:hypothetical protein [Paracoccaceae bacterium]